MPAGPGAFYHPENCYLTGLPRALTAESGDWLTAADIAQVAQLRSEDQQTGQGSGGNLQDVPVVEANVAVKEDYRWQQI